MCEVQQSTTGCLPLEKEDEMCKSARPMVVTVACSTCKQGGQGEDMCDSVIILAGYQASQYVFQAVVAGFLTKK